jgi:methionine aminotransferase
VLYDGRRHASVLAHSELCERSFAVFSFGKTLHATGWRVGYCVAPPALTRELRKVHQFNTFSIVSPLQYAIARYLAAHSDAWTGLSAFFQAKRDLLAGLLRGSGFEPIPAAGTYFQLVDYGALSSDGDVDFADRLIREAKIATIPLSPFYAVPPAMTLLRLCVAKHDATLESAAERLCAFAAAPRMRKNL